MEGKAVAVCEGMDSEAEESTLEGRAGGASHCVEGGNGAIGSLPFPLPLVSSAGCCCWRARD